MITKINNKTQVSLVILITAILYIIYVLSGNLLGGTDIAYDDHLLLGPLRQITSLNDYWVMFTNGQIYDVQPIRDFTYIIDIFIERNFNFKSFHFFNFIYWLIFSFFTMRVFSEETSEKKEYQYIVLALMLIHPIGMICMSWVSARKHILSCMFIMMATYYSSGYRPDFSIKRKTLITLLFLLSLLAQPITIFWGIWFVLNTFVIEKKFKEMFNDPLCYMLGVVTLSIAVLNQWYYSGLYLETTNYSKYQGETLNPFFIVLAIGRHIFQVVLPYKYAMYYDKGSILNLVGLVLTPILLYISYKSGSNRKLIKWSTFMFIPLIPIVMRETNIFVSDTYIPLTLVGLLILIFSFKNSLMAYIWSAILIVSSIYSSNIPSLFQELDRLVVHSFETEKTADSIKHYADYVGRKGEYSKALSYYEILVEDYPEYYTGQAAFGTALITGKSVPLEYKMKRFEEAKRTPLVNYYYSRLLFQQGKPNEALAVSLNDLGQADKYGQFLSHVYSFFLAACKAYNYKECPKVISIINETELNSYQKKTIGLYTEQMYSEIKRLKPNQDKR